MELITTENIIALFTLTALEIVLGIDNIIFIAIVAGKLPQELRDKARIIGLSLAVITRVGLLMTLSWFMTLTKPLFNILSHDFTGRDLVLLGGGLFLMAKATTEIHEKFDKNTEGSEKGQKVVKFINVIIQILILDIIFSIDSVITAVGMVNNIPIMVSAILLSIGVMLIFSKSIVGFIERNPTIKMLALSFLIMIGVLLVAESFGKHIEKGYVYFAMAFSLFVEMLNIKMARRTPARLLESEKK